MSCGKISARLKKGPSRPMAMQRGKGEPNLVSVSLAKIPVCMEQKLIQIRLDNNQNFLGYITDKSSAGSDVAGCVGLIPSTSQLSLVLDLFSGGLCLMVTT